MIRRLYTDGYDTGEIAGVIDGTYGTTLPSIYSAYAMTGNRGLLNGRKSAGVIANVGEFRVSYFMYHLGWVNATSSGAVMLMYTVGPTLLRVEVDALSSLLRIVVNNQVVASVDWSSANLSAIGTHKHLGINAKIDSVNGYISVYVNGEKVLSYSGNTGSANATGVFTTARGGSNYLNPLVIDNTYIDEIAGEPDVAPPALYMNLAMVNGPGDYTEWTPSAGANYQNVDDPVGANDGDATINYVALPGKRDSFALSAPSIPAGFEIVGVVVDAVVRKGGTEDVKAKLGIRNGGIDTMGTEQNTGVAYEHIQERFAVSSVSGLQVIIESAGTFV